MENDPSSASLMLGEIPASESVPSSLVRPEIPFGGLTRKIIDRIEEFYFTEGRLPGYVVMGPELWQRLYIEKDICLVLGDTLTITGVMGFAILDFGDEIVCADHV